MTLPVNIDFLRCPITSHNLSLISNQLLEEINISIKNKNVFYYDGRILEDQLEFAFINEDRLLAYMLRSGIIWLMSNFAIILNFLAGQALSPIFIIKK